jgi:cytochrome c peroxidase
MLKNKNILFSFTVFFLLSFSLLKKLTPYDFPKPFNFPAMPQSRENPVSKEGVELGRFLFYDPVLSRDSSISCASCHKQEFAFSDSPNQFSRGSNDQLQKRNTPPLFNLAWYPKLFWDGRVTAIEEQVFHPVREISEMNMMWTDVARRISRSKFYAKKFERVFGSSTIDSVLVSKAIAQFERTLISYNSNYDKALRKEVKYNADELEGFELMNEMNKGACLHCHTTDGDGLGTTGLFSNNGLDEKFSDEGLGKISGNKKESGHFKIPSLRNLLFTAPYMHDGRFKTLEEVLDFYSEGLKASPTIDSKMTFAHQGGAKLTKEEKRKIIAFLKTMSDSAFIKDKRFSNPFK